MDVSSYPGYTVPQQNMGNPQAWNNFSSIYPQYQQLMWNNNASANADMNKIGGAGASRGTPYSSALGQLAQQGASGLQSLFAGSGGYSSQPQQSQQTQQSQQSQKTGLGPMDYGGYAQVNAPSSEWYHDQTGYESYLRDKKAADMLAANKPNVDAGTPGYSPDVKLYR